MKSLKKWVENHTHKKSKKSTQKIEYTTEVHSSEIRAKELYEDKEN